MQKRKIIIPTLVLGVVTVAGISSINYASAANQNNQRVSVVQRIAEKFNLNQEEVEAVFNEGREERQAEMKQKREERLNALVSEGKLTESQKNALVAKQAEMQKKRDAHFEEMKNLSVEERKEKAEEYRKTNREEMKKFFEEQGIDESLLTPLGGQGEGMGMGRGGQGQRLGRK